MLITIPSYFAKNGYVTNELRVLAYQYVKKYHLKPSEYSLDNYLKEKYKIGLKQACQILISKCIYQSDGNKKIIITFKDQSYHDLAALITYGNGVVSGSSILQHAFRKY